MFLFCFDNRLSDRSFQLYPQTKQNVSKRNHMKAFCFSVDSNFISRFCKNNKNLLNGFLFYQSELTAGTSCDSLPVLIWFSRWQQPSSRETCSSEGGIQDAWQHNCFTLLSNQQCVNGPESVEIETGLPIVKRSKDLAWDLLQNQSWLTTTEQVNGFFSCRLKNEPIDFSQWMAAVSVKTTNWQWLDCNRGNSRYCSSGTVKCHCVILFQCEMPQPWCLCSAVILDIVCESARFMQ